MSRRLVRILATTAAVMLVQAADSGAGGGAGGGGPPEYEVEVIPGPFCGIFGYEPAVGLGINDLGHICGYHFDCNNDDQPFFWSPQTGRVVLDIPTRFSEGRAQDLNSAGEIVGFLRLNVRPQAILWHEDQVIELGVPPDGDSSNALAINSKSQVAGYWGNLVFGPSPLAFVWQDGVITDLTPDLGAPRSIANDNNDLGMATGWMGTNENTDAHAFIWDNGKVTDLGVIPGGFTGMGMAINNQGDVAVQGLTFNDKAEVIVRSFLWRAGQWIDLGVLPGCEETRVRDLIDAGQAVGFCEGPGAFAEFVWHNGVMFELDELWVSDDPEFTGIAGVGAISNEGRIAGSGLHVDFSGVAIRLTPILPPLGDLDGDGSVSVSDLLILLGAWGPCADCADCVADLDEDCVVGVKDLLILLGNWG